MIPFVLDDEERLFAFLEDLYIVTPNLDKVQDVHGIVQRELWVHSRIRINEGKTQVWNSGSVRPEFCGTNRTIGLVCWALRGHDDFTHLQDCHRGHQFLLDRIPEVTDLQSAWALLLLCASVRADHMFVVRPELVQNFAESHDMGLWTIVQAPECQPGQH